MSESINHQCSCFCGAVEFELSGDAEAMAYCHCHSCRRWSAGPVSAFTLWKPESLRITRGENKIASYDNNPLSGDEAVVSKRQWCRSCGGHVFTDHPTMHLVDVPAAVISGFEFAPAFHVHYQESVHAMKDGLPKFSDLPEPAGGSGRLLAE